MRGGVCPQEHLGKSRTPPIGVNVLTFLDLHASIMSGSLVTSHLDLCTNDVRKNPVYVSNWLRISSIAWKKGRGVPPIECKSAQ